MKQKISTCVSVTGLFSATVQEALAELLILLSKSKSISAASFCPPCPHTPCPWAKLNLLQERAPEAAFPGLPVTQKPRGSDTLPPW